MDLDNIPRIEASNVPAHLAASAKPVVIEGLLSAARIAETVDIAGVRSQFGNIEIRLVQEYSQWFMARNAGLPSVESITCTIAEYLSGDQTDTTLRCMLCTEYPTPRPILESCSPLPVVLNVPGVLSQVFIGHADNCAHLHFDGDGKHTILYQVAGRKQVVLVPPCETHKLAPINNFSSLFIERLSAADRRGLLTYLGANETTLFPGDAVLIPRCYWHYLNYVDTGVSINFRLPDADRFTRFFREKVHLDFGWQAIVAGLDDPAKSDAARASALEVMIAYFRNHEDASARFREVRDCLRRGYAELGGQAEVFYSRIDDLEERHWRESGLYVPSEPDLNAFASKASARQTIEDLLGEANVAPDRVRCLLRRQFGKDALDHLDLVEAYALHAALSTG